MSIPTEFNGRISAFFNTGNEFISWVSHDKNGDCWADNTDGWIRISNPQPISCQFFDARNEQIKALEKQIEKERAESQFRINQMLGKIQELQAIEAK